MKYKSDITKPAELDIAEAVRYIAIELRNLTAANNLLDDIEKAVESLNKMPKRYPLVKDEFLASLGFRFMPVNNYLVFYIVRDEKKTVTVERVLHSRRNWSYMLTT